MIPLPQTLQARAMIVLGTVFLLSHAAGLVVYEYNRDRTIVLTEATDLADRIVGIVELANGFPQADRQEILAAAQTQFLAMFPDMLPPAEAECRDNDYARRISERLRQVFDELPGHSVEACVRDLKSGPASLRVGPRNGFDVLISISFPDDQRTVFHAVLPDDSSILNDPVLLYFLVVLIVALMIASYLIRRVIAPLERLAGAAEIVGLDVDAPPLSLEGPAEVQAAAGALNQMQDRLRRLIHNQRDILAAVSHDLRSSLTRLRLRVDLLKDENARDGLARVIWDMQRMVESVLDFVRGIDIDEKPRFLDVGALLESLCVDLVEEGYAVQWCEPAPVARVRGRPMALQRAFQNLIFNAVKYGGCAEVSLEAAEEVIAISVKDQGPGIPTEQLEEVMKPFYRLDGSRNPDTGGVGLGLAIVRNVLQAHGGNLVLSNHPQGGLIALVTLPLSASTD